MRQKHLVGLMMLFCFFLISFFPTLTHAAHLSVTWTGGGDGKTYCDPQNWDLGIIPCNVGTVTFDVTILPNYTVEFNCSPCGVNKLTLDNNSRLKILPGCSISMDTADISGIIEADGCSINMNTADISGTINANACTISMDTADISGIIDADGGNFTANPFYLSGNRARVYGVNEAYVGIAEGSYSSTGLTANDGRYNIVTYTWELFNASGIGTELNLSSLQSIDAGYNQNSNDKNRQSIIASDGGFIDLSGVKTITAPGYVYDWIEFNVSGDAGINLNGVETITPVGRGRTRFIVSDGGLLSLPKLMTASNVTFHASGGAKVNVKDTQATYSSILLTANDGRYNIVTYTFDLFTASGIGTELNLSSLQSIDAGYNQNSNDKNRQSIIASDGGFIDLSGVKTITAPGYVYDWIEFNVSGDTSINLNGVETITPVGRGRTRFIVSDGGLLSLPKLMTASNVTFHASGGAKVNVKDTQAAYSSIMLTTNDGHGNVVTYTWELFNASGIGTELNLSSLQSINAGYNQNSNDKNRQSIIASDGGFIDLSGVKTITAPSYVYDWIEFDVSGDTGINLNGVETITPSGRGRTRFIVSAGGLLSLPKLMTASNVTFHASEGAKVNVKDTQATYSSILLTANDGRYNVVTYTFDLFNASGIGTELNLSSLQNIDAGYNQNGNDINRQMIIASDNAVINLSGVGEIMGPKYQSDSLEFIISDNALIDLSSLMKISNSGRKRFEVVGGLLLLGSLNSGGRTEVTVTGKVIEQEPVVNEEVDNVLPGALHILNNLNPGGDTDIFITGVESEPETAHLFVDGNIILDDSDRLILSKATLNVRGNLHFDLTEEDNFKAGDSIVQFDGNSIQYLEVGGLDVDTWVELLSNDNFGFGQLIVGQDGKSTIVILQDALDNGNLCKQEALYLFGLDDPNSNGLRILDGSTLVLNGINLYAFQEGALVHINSLFQPGENGIVYDGGFIQKGLPACEGDFDNDGDVDGSDLSLFAGEFGRTNCTSSDPCLCDFCGDGDVDGSDLSIFANDFGRTNCPISKL